MPAIVFAGLNHDDSTVADAIPGPRGCAADPAQCPGPATPSERLTLPGTVPDIPAGGPPLAPTAASTSTSPPGSPSGTPTTAGPSSEPPAAAPSASASLPARGPGRRAGGPLAVSQRTVPLGAFADNDGIGLTRDPDSGFDGSGATFPRSEIPEGRTSVGGVEYVMLGDDEDNVVARGQTIAMLPGRYGRLSVLAAASFGPAGGIATIRYSDGSTATARMVAPDWAKGRPGALRTDFRVDQAAEVNTKVSIHALSLPLDPNRAVAAITLPTTSAPAENAPSLHVFALTLVPGR